jgi:hypothetical protein
MDLGDRGVARRGELIDIGFRDEAAADQLLGASDCATRTCAASDAAVCVCTERSTVASTWPAFTQSPGSTSTCRIIPPCPATPTGISRRAASEPVAVMTWPTLCRPGAITLTAGT